MKFKLTISVTGTENILPVNYQYEFSSWIYKTLNFGNTKFANWLHNCGYTNGNKTFKLFTFSRLMPDKYRIQKDRMEILSNQAVIYISFYMSDAAEPFILGVFKNQSFSIGDKQSRCNFNVSTIEKVQEPEWNDEMQFKVNSPVVVSAQGLKHAQYLAPTHKEYGNYFVQNLINKYASIITSGNEFNEAINLPQEDNLNFILTSKPVSKLITIKAGTKEETKIRGFEYNFTLKAPPELMKIGFYSGFGEKNSLGFGSVDCMQ